VWRFGRGRVGGLCSGRRHTLSAARPRGGGGRASRPAAVSAPAGRAPGGGGMARAAAWPPEAPPARPRPVRAAATSAKPSSSGGSGNRPPADPPRPPPPTSSPLHAALGLSLDATPADARAAFRRVAAACHPDVDASEEAAASLAAAAAAAAVLSRPAAAARYAEGGLAAVPDAERAFGREGKKKGGRAPRAAPTPPPLKGDDVTAALWLTFEEAALGCTREVSLTARRACAPCEGTGEGGAPSEPCATCSGAGVVPLSRSRATSVRRGVAPAADARPPLPALGPCPACGGSGLAVARMCAACGGAGVAPAASTASVRVPAGATEASALRLAGAGHASATGGPPGDAYVLLSVARGGGGWARAGLDVVSPLALPPAVAVLGDRALPVRTLRGPATLRVPAGTQHGARLVLKGAGAGGVARAGRGDHIFEVALTLPASPDALPEGALAVLYALRALQAKREAKRGRL